MSFATMLFICLAPALILAIIICLSAIRSELANDPKKDSPWK